jgi:hypothetical protein
MSTQLSFNAYGTSNLDSEFSNQLAYKENILKALYNSINQSIRVIEKSEKLIDVIIFDKSSSPLYRKDFTQLKKEAALEKIEKFQDRGGITVKFYDLKAHSDIETSFQAKNTIEKALKRYPALKNIDITFYNLDKNQAINLIPSFKSENK